MLRAAEAIFLDRQAIRGLLYTAADAETSLGLGSARVPAVLSEEAVALPDLRKRGDQTRHCARCIGCEVSVRRPIS